MPAIDFTGVDVVSFSHNLARPGFPLFAVGVMHAVCLPLACDFSQTETPPLLRSFAYGGVSPLCVGLAFPGSPMIAFDFSTSGAVMASHRPIWLGPLVIVLGGARPSFILSPPDRVALGSILTPRSCAQSEFVLFVASCTRVGILIFAPGHAKLRSVLSSQSLAHIGTLLALLGFGVSASFVFALDLSLADVPPSPKITT